ncbi:MAG: hypothetical protein R6U96_12790 [Promethearchaeia archaeon]
MTGKNKKMHYPIVKSIRINKSMETNWNPEEIRGFLKGDSNLKTLLQKLYEIMETKMKFTSKLSEENIETIKRIEEVIE